MNFESLYNLEWLVEDESVVVVTDLLINEHGHGKGIQEICGDTAARVTQRSNGPEYEWSRLRAEEFRLRQFFLFLRTSLHVCQGSVAWLKAATARGPSRQEAAGACEPPQAPGRARRG